MRQPDTPLSVRFIPTGRNRVRLICRLSAEYTLYGEYVNGRLRDVRLVRK